MEWLKTKLDLDEEYDEEDRKVVKLTPRKLLTILIIALLVVILILAIAWRLTVRRNNTLKQQLKEKDEKIAAQSDTIETYRVRVGDAETNTKETIPVITSEQLKECINSIAELSTQEYMYTNADKRESSEEWLFGMTRPFSAKTLVITYDGTIKAGIDLSEVEVDVDDENKKIQITLPHSTITEHNIPQENIEVVTVENGLFNPVTIDDFNDFVKQQKADMEKTAKDKGILNKADEAAKQIVTSFIKCLPGTEEYKLEISFK